MKQGLLAPPKLSTKKYGWIVLVYSLLAVRGMSTLGEFVLDAATILVLGVAAV